MIAKRILPWFGGAAAVWTACMLFFQTALLAGYFYGHALERFVSPRLAPRLHIGLLALALLVPVLPAANWTSFASGAPTLQILLLLVVTVGLPYVLLASTSPLLQAAYAKRRDGATPYRFFALSNLASLIGLLSYPILIEPHLTVHQQAAFWRGLFALYVLSLRGRAVAERGARARTSCGGRESAGPRDQRPDPLGGIRRRRVDAPALGHELPVREHRVGAFSLGRAAGRLPAHLRPLLRPPAVVPALGFPAACRAWASSAISLLFYESDLALQIRVAGPVVVAGTVRHLHVPARRGGPPQTRSRVPHAVLPVHRSRAARSAVLLVGIGAPKLLAVPGELPIVIVVCAVLVLVARIPPPWLTDIVWALVVVFAMYAAGSYLADVLHRQPGHRDGTSTATCGSRTSTTAPACSFTAPSITARNGSTQAGATSPPPTTPRAAASAGPSTAPGIANQRVGVIGLGTGTIAAFARPGRCLPLLRDQSPGVGDGAQVVHLPQRLPRAGRRRSWATAACRSNASRPRTTTFSPWTPSPAIPSPSHLLSHEAMTVYLRHLKPSGILALHITNRGPQPGAGRLGRRHRLDAQCPPVLGRGRSHRAAARRPIGS